MTCSKGPPAGIEPGSAAFMACALTTRPPARPTWSLSNSPTKCGRCNLKLQQQMTGQDCCYFTSSICRRAHVERASGSDTRPSLLPSAMERIWLTRLARLACSPSLDWWEEKSRHFLSAFSPSHGLKHLDFLYDPL